MLLNKLIRQIKKEYPQKSVEQIADELKVPVAQVYKALGLRKEYWINYIEDVAGYLVILLLLVSPANFYQGLI